VALGVNRHTNQTARHLALVLVLDSEESRMRTTITKRNTKALGRTEGNIGTKLARRLEDGQSKQIRRNNKERSLRKSYIYTLVIRPTSRRHHTLACSLSAMGWKSRTMPEALGYWTRAPQMSLPAKLYVAASPISTLISKGSARV